MSFPAKFKIGGSNTNDLPQGVNIENTSFGYQQNQKPYMKPPMQNNQANTQKTKPRGGWDDDDEDDGSTQIRGGSGQFRNNQPTQPTQQNQSIQQVQSPGSTHSGGSEDPNLGPKTKKINLADFELIQIDENFVASHEFENRTINDLIQPGGARMKQPDSALNGFCKAAESFPAPVIGSLLLSKLNEEIPFVSKARILFLLEAIIKKVKKYYDYFHHNLQILRQFDFSNEGMNGNQLKKLLDDIIKYIEEPNKPKPVPVYNTPANLIQTSTSQSANLLGDDDLLGGPSQPKKQDPFEFIKSKQTSDSSSSQQSQGSTSHQQQQHFELLDAPVESQPFHQQQSQPQPKKFDPFGLSNNSNSSPFPAGNTSQQNTAKPSGGLPGNFKKFQAGASSQATPTNNNANQNLLDGGFGSAPTTTNNTNTATTKFDQLDDLLNDLTIGSNDSGSQPSTNQQQNAPSQHNQNQGFGTPSSNQGQNQNQNQGFGTPQNNQQFGQNNFSSQQNQQGFNNNQNQGKPSQQQQQGGFPQQMGGFQQGGYPQQYQQGYPQQGYPQNYPQQGYPQQYQQGYPQQYPQQGYPQQFPGYGYGQGQGQGQFGGQNFQGQPGFNQNQGNQGNNNFNNWQPGKK